MQTEKRKSFVVYTDYAELFDELTDLETAEIFKAMLKYASGEKVPEFSDKHVKVIFRIIKNQMDRDNEKYVEICRKRREAGKKGAEAKSIKRSSK